MYGLEVLLAKEGESEGVYFDFAVLHSYALDSIGQIFRDPNGTFASRYQSKEKGYLTKLDELIETYLGE